MRYANTYGFCELNAFPGCAQIVVSNNRFIYPALRGKGLGRFNHKVTLNRMRSLGYDAAVCTVRSSNTAEIKILLRSGWTKAFGFTNKVTGHYVELWFIQL